MDKGLLNDATSTDDSPTPGYMLSEIARMYFITFLGISSFNIAYKAPLLRVMPHAHS